MTEKKRKVNSRWIKGAVRYDKVTQDVIDRKYHEAFGWRNGAKVRRRP